jgi:hypothetical protein
MKITIAILIQNAELWRLKTCILSNLTQTRTPDNILVVDLSSDNLHKHQYKELIKNLNLKYQNKIKIIESDKVSEVFSPAHACNLAWKNTDSDVIVFTGIDEVAGSLNCELVEKIFKFQKQVFITSARLDLGHHSSNPSKDFVKDFDHHWIPKPLHYTCAGSYLGLSTEWLKSVGGFDEYYQGWGKYDLDIQTRAKKSGLKEYKLHEYGGRLMHIYHGPRDYTNRYDLRKRNNKYYDEKFK